MIWRLFRKQRCERSGWQPGMTVRCITPTAWLEMDTEYRVRSVLRGCCKRDGLIGDGLMLEGIKPEPGMAGWDARRFLIARCA